MRFDKYFKLLEDVESPSITRGPALVEGYRFFDMPKLATSWEELLEVLRERGLNAKGCIA
jgi:hypothetical protein